MQAVSSVHRNTRVHVEGVFPSTEKPELLIAKVARCSYGAQPKSVAEDERLIRYLQRHKHTSPFEMVNITFFLENIPLFCATQILRHRTGKFNVKSHRYTESSEEESFLDIRDRLRIPHKHNKQSSDDVIPEDHSQELIDTAEEAHSSVVEIRKIYSKLVSLGVAKEVARSILPEGELTSMYVQFDLNNLCKFLSLRLHPTAQKETREIAQAMCDLAKVHFPIVIGGMLEDMEGMFVSAREIAAVQDGEDAPKLSPGEQKALDEKMARLRKR